MKILVLLSTFFLLQPELEKVYSMEENVCHFSYSVVRQWELELKEGGTFILTYKKNDGQFGKVFKRDFIGKWENRSDTVVFISSSPVRDQWYFKTAKYVVSGKRLKLIGTDAFLPASFVAGQIFTVRL